MDNRVQKTKAALRQALFALLEDQPIHQITVTALCRRAGVGRRTFYVHYDRIDDIFEEYRDELYDQIVRELGRPSSPTALLTTFEQILQANFAGFRQLCLNNAHAPLIQRLEDLLYSSLTDLYNPQGDPANQVTLAYLSAGLIKAYLLWFRENKIPTATLEATNRRLYATLLGPDFLR